MRVFWRVFWEAIEEFGYLQTLGVLVVVLVVLSIAYLIVRMILDFFTVGDAYSRSLRGKDPFESDWKRLRRRFRKRFKRWLAK